MPKRTLDKFDIEAENEGRAISQFRKVSGNVKHPRRVDAIARKGHAVPTNGSGDGRYFAERLHRVG